MPRRCKVLARLGFSTCHASPVMSDSEPETQSFTLNFDIENISSISPTASEVHNVYISSGCWRLVAGSSSTQNLSPC